MEKVNFLLPMKGHSERVKNKNLKIFVNTPLYHFIVKEILKSKFLNKIYVDTDSEKIVDDISNNFPDIQIIKRPSELIGDFVSMNKIIEHDLSVVDGEYFLQTHSTNPLLTAKSIDGALDFFLNKEHKFDSVFSVTKLQTRLYWEDGNPINHNPNELLRTQDLPPVLEENSNFYIFTRTSFKSANNKRIGLKPFLYAIQPIEAVDIDTEFNFTVAENIYKTLNS